ncbi:MAG: aspartate ammonia-lyase [Clostridia bacterium]|nr:aspartate ammonia-lyase [Clostridia bacterium]
MKTRKEKDSVGELSIPADAYYGVQTQRGYNNFQISGRRMDATFIKNITLIKKAAAKVNGKYGYISKGIEEAICAACDEILEGKFDEHFITDAIQGGAGTSVNMNVNEVIANRATELLGGKKGEYLCHPNDHVNMAQSTNDVIPTAGKMTTLDLAAALLDSLDKLIAALNQKSVEFDNVIKMGRTQLQDAVPIRLGQEFKAYADAFKRDHARIKSTLHEMHVVNLGGTAIGTSLNAQEDYLKNIVPVLAEECGYPLEQAEDLIDSTQNVDCFVAVSAVLKACAVNLSKMSNDLRLMSSGPKTGLGEIILPAKQNGSSIMPGKVNPVIPEVVSQVAFLVIGNDMTVSMAAEGGQLELNAFEPIIFYKLFESLTCLTNAIKTLTVNCIEGIKANVKRCEELLHSSVGVVTALCPYIGYKKAAEIAKEALKRDMKVKDLVLWYGLMDREELERILDPYEMT